MGSISHSMIVVVFVGILENRALAPERIDGSLPHFLRSCVPGRNDQGPGARLTQVSNVDVAPTIAELLGLDMKNTSGDMIREIIEAPGVH
jgi:hypothetical protein